MSEHGTDLFPDLTVEYDDSSPGKPLIRRVMATGGMSLRDFFAGHALAGLLARGEHADVPAQAYAIADMMVEQRAEGSA